MFALCFIVEIAIIKSNLITKVKLDNFLQKLDSKISNSLKTICSYEMLWSLSNNRSPDFTVSQYLL
jgi:hypothetical protein